LIYNKGDKTDRSRLIIQAYHHYHLHTTHFRTMFAPSVDRIPRDHQCGFRSSVSSDHMLLIRKYLREMGIK